MRKFKIPVIPGTEPKCARFPVDLIEKVEKHIKGKNCSFHTFVIHAVRYTLEHMTGEEKE